MWCAPRISVTRSTTPHPQGLIPHGPPSSHTLITLASPTTCSVANKCALDFSACLIIEKIHGTSPVWGTNRPNPKVNGRNIPYSQLMQARQKCKDTNTKAMRLFWAVLIDGCVTIESMMIHMTPHNVPGIRHENFHCGVICGVPKHKASTNRRKRAAHRKNCSRHSLLPPD